MENLKNSSLKKIWYYLKYRTLLKDSCRIIKIDDEDNFDYRCFQHGDMVYEETINKVYVTDKEYAIYSTIEGESINLIGHKNRMNKIQEIDTKYSNLKSYLSKKEYYRFSRSLAIAHKLVFNGEKEKAINIFDQIYSKARNLRSRKFKMTYVLSSFLMFLILGIPFVYYLIEEFNWSNKINEYFIFGVIFFGGLGGFLSVTTYPSRLNTEIPEAGYLFYVLEGFSRIFISIASSIIAYLMINSGFAFQFFKDSNYGIFLIASISGFAELLIPLIISNYATSEQKTKS